jgi:hypothetical protein
MAKQKGAQKRTSSGLTAKGTSDKRNTSTDAVDGESGVAIDRSILKMHDTPPPIVIGGGSVVFELDKEFDEITAGTPKKHIRKPPAGSTSNSVLIGHIKILDGSGEMLYRNLDADTCRIIITLDDDTLINVMGGSTLDIEAPRRLELGSGLDKPVSKKRKKRYRHKKSSSVESSIKKVQVVEGSDVLFSVLVDKLESKDDDFRVMLWLHED